MVGVGLRYWAFFFNELPIFKAQNSIQQFILAPKKIGYWASTGEGWVMSVPEPVPILYPFFFQFFLSILATNGADLDLGSIFSIRIQLPSYI